MDHGPDRPMSVSVRPNAVDNEDPLDTWNCKKKAAAVFRLARQSAAVTADKPSGRDMV